MNFIEDSSKDVDLSFLPSTRYYGSKKRLLPWIYEVASQFEFNSVFDRFGGTASVSLLFKKMGKEVTYHDALTSNTYSAHALLCNAEHFNKTDILKFFEEVELVEGVVTENFDGLYYSRNENMWLDGIVQKIQKRSDDPKQNFYWYCLFQACLKKRPFNSFHRANYYLRTANVKRSFGNYTTWNKSFLEHINEALNELDILFSHEFNNKKSKILVNSVLLDTTVEADLIYLDPPYITERNNSDDYFKRYHFLEGLIEYENWEKLFNINLKTKAIPTPKNIKDWNSKALFKSLLFKEIKKYKHKKVMLSYQAEGYPNIDSIYDFFVDQFYAVHIYKIPFSHALAKSKKTEVLIVGEPY